MSGRPAWMAAVQPEEDDDLEVNMPQAQPKGSQRVPENAEDEYFVDELLDAMGCLPFSKAELAKPSF